MKSVLLAFLAILFAAAPLLAVDDRPQMNDPGLSFEELKVKILQHLDEKIAKDNEEKGCVEAANSHDDLRECRRKYPPDFQGERGRRPQRQSAN